MKLKYIIGILAFLLLMVSTASAETFYLTKTNNNVTGVNISVTVTDTYIDVEDLSPTGAEVDIKEIALCLPDSYVTGVVDTSGNTTGWVHAPVHYPNKAGFGEFNTSCSSNDPDFTKGPIRISLADGATPLPKNALGYSIVVHLSYGGELTDVSTGKTYGSGWVVGGGTEIPEFPTVALPVAAIIGIMFIMGRKKE